MPAIASLEALERAVAEFEVTGLDVTIEQAALGAARHSLEESGLLLLGEVHGVRENPLIALALMNELNMTGLALEWPSELAPLVSAFLADGRLPDNPMLWGGDGRITAGHFAVLRELVRHGPAGQPDPVRRVERCGLVAARGVHERAHPHGRDSRHAARSSSRGTCTRP